ncbi:POC1 centriolar protein A-like isoform X1, partial [Leptotrombidium deliense]
MGDKEIPSLDASLKGHKCDVLAVDYLPNGKQLVSASSDGSLIFWNIEKSSKHSNCYRLSAHRDVIFGVSCASNGSFVLSCSRDKSVRLWKVENDRLSQNSNVYRSAATVRYVDSSPNCEYFCSASDDKTVKLWSSLHTNKYICSFAGHNNWVRSCKYSTFNENLIASCGDDASICLFDIRERRRLEKITSKTLSHFVDLSWYPKSDTLLSVASQDSSVRVYDIRMNKLIQYYGAHTQGVNSVSVHPLGCYLLSSSSDETSKIFDLLEGRILFTLRLHKGSVLTCKFSPN